MIRSAMVVLLSLSYSIACGQESKLMRWDRAVCLHTERKVDDGLPVFASAFLIEAHGQVYLITAKHSSQDSNAATRVVYRSKSGESQWVNLGGIVDSKTNPWLGYENSDLAIARLQENPDNGIYLKELRELAIPMDAIKTETPERTTQIEIVGFPLSLGSQPPVAPFAMVGHIASKELDVAAHWGNEKVYYALPTVASGTSGGPVFISCKDSEQLEVVGMYIGLVADNSGAKLTKVIPSRIVRAAIERHCDPRTSKGNGSSE